MKSTVVNSATGKSKDSKCVLNMFFVDIVSLKINHLHSTRATFEMPHKFFIIFLKSEIFTTSTYATLASTLKISAQNFDF